LKQGNPRENLAIRLLKIEEAATEMSFAAIEASGGAIKAARSSAIVPDDAIGSP